MNQRKITVLQALLLLILATSITNPVIVIPMLLDSASRDAWISVLLTIVPGTLLLLSIRHIMRTTGDEAIIPWVQRHFGTFTSGLIGAAFIVYLLMTAVISLKDTTNWVDATFLPDTPGFVIAGSLTLLCMFAAYSGLWPITICAGMLLPFVFLSEEFMMIANFQFKNYHYLTPVLENGWTPVLRGLIYSANGVLEIVILLLFQHHLKEELRYSRLFILLCVSCCFILIPLLDSIANFGPAEAARQRYPTFEQWGLVTLGKHVSHLDFLSIFEWLSGSFIRISLCMYLVVELFQIKKTRVRKLVFLGFAIGMFLIPLIPVGDVSFVWFLREWYYPLSLIFIILAMCLLFFFSLIIRAKERVSPSNAT